MSIDVTLLIALTYAVAALSRRDRRHIDRPLYNVAYDMGTLFGIKAFAVAILGGLTNPWGVVIAGLAYGLVEAWATTLAWFRQHPDRQPSPPSSRHLQWRRPDCSAAGPRCAYEDHCHRACRDAGRGRRCSLPVRARLLRLLLGTLAIMTLVGVGLNVLLGLRR